MSLFVSSTVFNKAPFGSFPSWDTFLKSANTSWFSLAFLSILLNLAIVMTLAFILLNFSLSYFFFSSFNSVIITWKSTSLLCLLILNCSLLTLFCLVSKWSIISPILSAKNGRDHENKSKLFGKLNGCSTSLYYLIFILSFSIKITAPLFL